MKVKRVFIGGMGRSGTTIALNAFYHHSELFAVPIETKFLVETDGFYDLYKALTDSFCTAATPVVQRRFFDLMRNQVTGVVPSQFQHQHELSSSLFRNYMDAVEELAVFLDKKAYLESKEIFLEATRRFISLTFDDLARISDKSGWVEKTPSNVWRVAFLKELFPDSYFLHLIRDPRNIFLSLLEKGWLPEKLDVSLSMFSDMLKALVVKRRQLFAVPGFHEVKLEHLEEQSEATLQTIAERLGLCEFSRSQIDAIHDTIRQYHEAKSGRTPRVALTDEQLRRVNDALMPMVVELGYPYNHTI